MNDTTFAKTTNNDKRRKKVSPSEYPFYTKYGCCSKISRSPKLLMEANDKKFKT